MPTFIKKKQKAPKRNDERHPVRQSLGWQMQVHSSVWSPPTDLYETEELYIVRMEIAGMREADFTVSIEGGFLVISGSRPDVQERRAYHQMEIRCGKFTSAIAVPRPIDLDKATAFYEDGFFVVNLPKIKPATIEIQEK